MLLNIKKFRVSPFGTEGYSIEEIRKLQKTIGINFPPDFLYINLSIGCIIGRTLELFVGDYMFNRTITFKDYETSSENFKLAEEYSKLYMAFAYSDSNQVFFIMGIDSTNLNQIFIIDNNFGESPQKVSDNVFSFFNYDLK